MHLLKVRTDSAREDKMARVSVKDLPKENQALLTLKSWYQAQINRLDKTKKIKDFSVFGPLNSFYYSARATYGGEYAVKTRTEWNSLYRDFLGTK